MELETPGEHHQDYCKQIAKEVLASDYITISIDQFVLSEDLINNITYVSCHVSSTHDAFNAFNLEGSGHGVVDVLFGSLVQELASTYFSLENANFEDFIIKVRLKESSKRTKTDAPVDVTLAISTSPFCTVYFRHKHHSMVSTVIEVVRESIEYLINLELAARQLYINTQDAKMRNRHDLTNKYISNLSALTKIISYEKTLKKIKENII